VGVSEIVGVGTSVSVGDGSGVGVSVGVGDGVGVKVMVGVLVGMLIRGGRPNTLATRNDSRMAVRSEWRVSEGRMLLTNGMIRGC
jgi:hypothetical protein